MEPLYLSHVIISVYRLFIQRKSIGSTLSTSAMTQPKSDKVGDDNVLLTCVPLLMFLCVPVHINLCLFTCLCVRGTLSVTKCSTPYSMVSVWCPYGAKYGASMVPSMVPVWCLVLSQYGA